MLAGMIGVFCTAPSLFYGGCVRAS
jgi:hypothetical protein